MPGNQTTVRVVHTYCVDTRGDWFSILKEYFINKNWLKVSYQTASSPRRLLVFWADRLANSIELLISLENTNSIKVLKKKKRRKSFRVLHQYFRTSNIVNLKQTITFMESFGCRTWSRMLLSYGNNGGGQLSSRSPNNEIPAQPLFKEIAIW